MTAQDLKRIYDKLSNEAEWHSISDSRKNVYKYTQPEEETRQSDANPDNDTVTGIYDSTASQENKHMAAAIVSYLWPPGQIPFMLRPSQSFMADPSNNSTSVENAKQVLSAASQQIATELEESNFSQELHTAVMDWCSVGEAILSSRGRNKNKDKDQRLRFSAESPLSIMYTVGVDKNPHTIVDVCYMSIEEILDTFPRESLKGDSLLKAIETNDIEKKFTIIHFLQPRDGGVFGAPKTQLPFASFWLNYDDTELLDEGGFHSNIYHISRFYRPSRSKYGRGPGVDGLPAFKVLNAVEFLKTKGLAKLIDPALVAPVNSCIGSIDTGPSGLIFSRTDTTQIRTIAPSVDLNAVEVISASYREKVEKIFYKDVLDFLANLQYATATEVTARMETRMAFILPSIGRLLKELFVPTIDRVYKILAEEGAVYTSEEGDLPLDYEIVFTSRMAVSAKLIALSSLSTADSVLLGYRNIDPASLYDNIDVDAVYRDILSLSGVEPHYLNPVEQRDINRQRRQQEQMQNAAMANPDKFASAAQKMGMTQEQPQ